MTQDLVLNLLSEFIGIVVTVLVIDRILKRREERRWLPAKQSLYAKLFNLTYDIVSNIVPFDMNDASLFLYSFGEFRVLPNVNIDNKYLQLGKMNDVHAELITSKKYDTTPLRRCREQLGELMERWVFLIEPEHLTKLIALEQSLDTVLRRKANFEDESSISDYAFLLSEVVVFASDHWQWLVKKADKKTSLKEFSHEIEEAHERIKKRYDHLHLQ